ncbi:hypothetical protein CLV42_107295 [Chitinophaga ginsengisoli]|uniref:Uncharacterized protein n=1 Tax=Chitinophaga ginsengisoli TaxID=363837 RepID=A0A2P8G5A0_9BACT|nr:hypothetical protein CLV42_107295 [Chitinophaga ginsengisoli]
MDIIIDIIRSLERQVNVDKLKLIKIVTNKLEE